MTGLKQQIDLHKYVLSAGSARFFHPKSNGWGHLSTCQWVAIGINYKIDASKKNFYENVEGHTSFLSLSGILIDLCAVLSSQEMRKKSQASHELLFFKTQDLYSRASLSFKKGDEVLRFGQRKPQSLLLKMMGF